MFREAAAHRNMMRPGLRDLTWPPVRGGRVREKCWAIKVFR